MPCRSLAGFIRLGGYEKVVEKYFYAYPNSTRFHLNNPDIEAATNYSYTQCGVPPANSMHLFRAASDPNLPWTGITFGLTISAVWYWCSDQVSRIDRTITQLICASHTLCLHGAPFCQGIEVNGHVHDMTPNNEQHACASFLNVERVHAWEISGFPSPGPRFMIASCITLRHKVHFHKHLL